MVLQKVYFVMVIFSSTTVTNVFHILGVQTKFIFAVHPQVNGQADSTNNVILKGINKVLDNAKGL